MCPSVPGSGVIVLTLLAMINVVLVLAILGFASGFRDKVFTSHGFKDAGKLLSDAMDLNVNPCDDYYNYACGGWMATARYRNGRTSKNAMFDTGNDITEDMIELFSDPKPSGSEIIDHLKNAYKMCIHANNSKVMETLLNDFTQTGESWPLLKSHHKNNDDITDLVKMVQNTAIMSLSVSADTRNKVGRHKHILVVSSPSFGMSSEHYKNQVNSKLQVNAFKHHMVTKIRLLRNLLPIRDDQSKADLAKKVDEMFALEKELVLAPGRFQYMPFKNLRLHFKGIDWKHLVSSDLPKKNPEVRVNVGYLKVLERILNNQSKREAFLNYVFWNYFRARFLDKYQFTGAFAEFDEMTAVLSKNALTNQSRKTACAATLNFWSRKEMPNLATGAMYAKKHVSKKVVEEVLVMIENVKIALIEILNETRWMSPKDKKLATAKLQHQNVNIAYPEWTLNNTLLDDYYRELIEDLDQNDTYSTYLSKIRKFIMARDFQKVGSEVDPKEFIYPSGFVNGQHSYHLNTMQLPAGMFRPPYFRLDYPKAVNYAILGAVIGHEYSHTFDKNGKDYDKFGNRVNWWDNSSLSHYDNLTGCLVDQFDKLKMPEIGQYVKGEFTLSENIGDDGGLKSAFRAYTNWLKTQPGGEEPRIPGFEHLTNKKMFFAAFGRGFCSMNTVYDKVERYIWDSHPVDAVMPIKNSPHFEEIFQCSSALRNLKWFVISVVVFGERDINEEQINKLKL
ncbi:hypothetical protein L596_027262 [Steinernema carpocapsae]|uniref:Peptidase M13 N-terminal domain-containing protein n=1 Tax=Steinernema carpocapsae TaxID=34508 RepID=A0A4U5M3U4_STECR|nr:hypothetical protein L596_027262 [Steinernema carpocapsae]